MIRGTCVMGGNLKQPKIVMLTCQCAPRDHALTVSFDGGSAIIARTVWLIALPEEDVFF
jgi:hypothetical protein